jgi:Tol biopolymer transport system component/DNA-binding winged helix-turn-helix (wHTH) protein
VTAKSSGSSRFLLRKISGEIVRRFMGENPRLFYEFGPFRVDETERRLTREGAEVVLSEDGKDERLSPKTFDLLLTLLKHEGRMVRREELIEHLWPGTFVEDNRLSDNISILRKFLGDTSKNSKFIETVPKYGYRFVAEVRQVSDELVAVVDQRKTRILIEEDDEGQVAGPALSAPTIRAERVFAASPPVPAKTIWLRAWFLAPVIILIGLILASAIWLIQSGRQARGAALPMMQTIQFTSFTGNEFGPALSPDGKLVAFSKHDGGHEDIFVQQVGSGDALQLTHTDLARNGSATWSPDGLNIAFIRQTRNVTGSGIFTVPPLGGPERKLFSLEKHQANAGLDWSPDGKQFVFSGRASDQEPFSLQLLSLETQELRRLTRPASVSDNDNRMAFSPDGQSIAFVRTSPETGDVYVIPTSGGEPRRLTSDNRMVLGVSWTTDGNHIVFSSNRGGSNFLLWKVPVGGGSPEPIPIGGDNAVSPDVSHSGNRLVFARATSDTNIYRATLGDDPERKDQGSVLISSTRHDRNAALSPDGRHIAFESTRTGNFEIWMTDAEGQKPVQLTSFNGPVVGNPSWSPDGHQIAFQSRIESHADIQVVSIDGGSPRRLTTESSNELSPAWSHDGRWIYFSSDRTGTYQVWKIPAGGGAATQVTRNGGFEAAESDDGQSLYYTKYHTKGIFQVPLAGGEETTVLDLPELESWGDWYLAKEGIYFLDRKNLPRTSFQFFDFATRRARDVMMLEKDPGQHPGLNVSADQRSLIYSRCDVCNYDIMLVENFH